jgi:diguanylate cyclase (GGDEF)-like protein/putative nucleotidyltransferase with HDIG domain
MSTNTLQQIKHPNYLARVYFWCVFGLGVLAFIYAMSTTPATNLNSRTIWEFVFFVTLNIFAELAITRIPVGGALTASFSVILTVLLVLGPVYAIVSSIIGASISTIFMQKRHWSVTLFNSGLFSIIFVTAGAAVEHLKTIFTINLNDRVFSISILAFVVTLIYMILSSIIVNTYIHLTSGVKVSRLIKEDRWEFAQLVILAPISVLGVYFYYSIGIFATLAAFFPAIITVYAIKNYMNTYESNANLKTLNEDLEQLYEITKKISRQTRMKELWLTISSETRTLIPYDRCLIFLINKENTRLMLESGDLLYAPAETYDLLDNGPLQNCIAKRVTVVNNDFIAPDSYAPSWQAYKSVLVEPIVVEGEVIGVICLLSEGGTGFSYDHLKFVRLLLSSVENTIKSINLYLQTQGQALKDGLTGLYNQKYFKIQVESELSRAYQYKYDTSVIMFDVDYFKKFNDTHGHLLGDLVLKDMARILNSFIKNTHVLARYGGEEFAILLPETNLHDACELAEKIRIWVRDFKFTGREQREIHLSVSIGVNTHTPEMGEVSKIEFIDRADTALYRAKNEGRNQVYQAIYKPDLDQLIIKNYGKTDKTTQDKKNLYVFTLDKESCIYWKSCFEKFANWYSSEENINSKSLNTDYKQFFINLIIKKLEFSDKKLNTILTEEEVESNILTKLYFPTDFYKFEMELEDLEKAIFDYIATIKATEIEKEHIRKIVIGIFNKVYAMAIKYTSNHYQKIVDYHTNIAHINSEIGSISTKRTFYSNIAKLTSEILSTKFAFIAELDSSRRFFTMKSFYGINDFELAESLANIEFSADKITNRLINYAETVELNEDDLKDSFVQQINHKLTVRSAILIPLVQKDKKVTGMLACLHDNPKTFTIEELRICGEIAERVIKAISRIEKNISERDSYLEIIKSMIDIFEAKDTATRDHSKNISRLAGRISNALEIQREEQKEIRTAAYLHDIGKIGLSEVKLNDEGSLRSHPLIGARLVSAVQELKNLASAIRHHHENWDGSGYPDGLEGSSIPLYSRIISIANAYDKYLKASSGPQEALDKMKASLLFDPEICDVVKKKVF